MPGDYFAERTPEPAQYLNLMKSIWIIKKFKKGDEYAQTSSDRLWACYVKELDEVNQPHSYSGNAPGRCQFTKSLTEMPTRVSPIHNQRAPTKTVKCA